MVLLAKRIQLREPAVTGLSASINMGDAAVELLSKVFIDTSQHDELSTRTVALIRAKAKIPLDVNAVDWVLKNMLLAKTHRLLPSMSTGDEDKNIAVAKVEKMEQNANDHSLPFEMMTKTLLT